MPTLELRPRHGPELVDAAFQLYRRHFLDFVTISAVSLAPVVLLELLLPVDELPGLGEVSAPYVTLALFGWVCSSLMEGATMVAASNAYLASEPAVGGALRSTLRRFGTVLVAVTVKWFLISLGFAVGLLAGTFASMGLALAGVGDSASRGAIIAFVLIVFAGFIGLPLAAILFARYFAVPATILLEGLGVRAALRRSRELSRGFRGRIIGALGIPMILLVFIPLVLSTTLTIFELPPLLVRLVDRAVSIIAYPLAALIATLLYYDARIRKEGFDIDMLAAMELDRSPAPPSIPG